MQDWLWATASDLGRKIGTGEIDPVDLCEAYLAAIDAHPFRDRIYARVTPDRARSEAAAASKRAKTSQRLSLLDGVPISWKDNMDSAGIATEAGSALLEGRVPTQDAEVLRNATAAGLVCLGKTHMTELAFSGLGLNPITKTPPNRYDPDAAPGGSSSGAAASVGYGLAAAGIGSDTGGSVRLPSTWNDLVGFKPTHNGLSLTGVVPLAAKFDTVGPLARSVEDAAQLYAALRGDEAPDLASTSLTGVKVLILETIALDDVRDMPRAAFNSAVERISAAGAEITRGTAPGVQEAMDLAGILYTSECYGTWGAEIEAAPDKMYPPVRERFQAGAAHRACDYIAAWHQLTAHRAAYATAVAGYDAVIMPSVPITPPNVDALMADADFFASENLLALRNTRIGNVLGLASITVPTGLPSTGIMLNALPGQDRRLLRLAVAVEAALA